MSEQTKIEWADDTHNFWRGCVKVSPGCANCYAEVSTPVRVARSEGRELWGGTLRDRAKNFDAPLRWNAKPWICDGCGKAHGSGALVAYGEKQICDGCGWREATFHRRRVFSLSLGDIWDKDVPIEWLADALDVIRRCENLDFLLLTKRAENFFSRTEQVFLHLERSGVTETAECRKWISDWADGSNPPANIWIGCTVENQEYAEKRIPELLKIPAVCRFISYEPAIGPVNFHLNGEASIECTCCKWKGHEEDAKFRMEGEDQFYICPDCAEDCAHTPINEQRDGENIHWIIIGGESGPKARPFNIEWARSTVAQCRAARVACFVKQLGAKPVESIENPNPPPTEQEELNFKRAGFCRTQLTDNRIVWQKWPKLTDKKGGDMAEWPEDLRLRQFPQSPICNHQ